MKNEKKQIQILESNRYGWVVVAGSLLLLMVLMGIVMNCFAIFIIPVTESMGFSRSAYSVCQSLNFLCCMVSAANCWKLYQRFGLVRTIRIACIVLIGAYFMYSQAHSLLTFYLISSVIGLCMGLTTTAAVPMLLRGWFRDRYGMAVGVAMMGSGVGGMIFNPLDQKIMVVADWRVAYMVLAGAIAVIALPVVFFIFQEGPGFAGDEKKESAVKVGDISAPVSSARKSGIMVLLLIHAVCSTVLFFTVTPYLQDIGYSAEFAAACASVTMAVLAVGKLLQGVLLDRLTLRSCTAIALISMVMGLVALAFFRSPIMMIPVLLAVGLSCPYGTVAVPAVACFFSRGEEQERAMTGQFTAVVNLGCAVTPALSGMVFDAMESYVPLFVCAGALVFLCVFSLKWLFPGCAKYI